MNAISSHHAKWARRRAGRLGAYFCAAAGFAALVALDHSGRLLVRNPDDLAKYHGVECQVLRVIDGDTLEVDVADLLNQQASTRIVLWGIDAPEPAGANRIAEPFSDEAKALAESRTAGSSITLWLEAHETRDRFGRVMAHIELKDRSRLNEALLETGLARADERRPHSYLTRYAQLQHSAQRRGVGMWGRR